MAKKLVRRKKREVEMVEEKKETITTKETKFESSKPLVSGESVRTPPPPPNEEERKRKEEEERKKREEEEEKKNEPLTLEEQWEELNEKAGPNPTPNREGNEYTLAITSPNLDLELAELRRGYRLAVSMLKRTSEGESLNEEDKKEVKKMERYTREFKWPSTPLGI